jgi:lipoate-protein ligase A
LQLLQTPILSQLRLEEALLRSHTGNWCVLNRGPPAPSIVMGISGVAERLVDMEAARAAGVPILRRFTGGGTVVVDDGTLFISFVCNKVRGGVGWGGGHLHAHARHLPKMHSPRTPPPAPYAV